MTDPISNELLNEILAGLEANPRVGTNSGHGHVWKRPDGRRMRCGGPGMCSECSGDAMLLPKPASPDTIRSLINEIQASRRQSPAGVVKGLEWAEQPTHWMPLPSPPDANHGK